jgi:hypothetical protein
MQVLPGGGPAAGLAGVTHLAMEATGICSMKSVLDGSPFRCPAARLISRNDMRSTPCTASMRWAAVRMSSRALIVLPGFAPESTMARSSAGELRMILRLPGGPAGISRTTAGDGRDPAAP